jgi:hypothetical protein
MDEIETISDFISLDTPECIADSVDMSDMFPQLWAESLLYEGNSDKPLSLIG